jgi:hypothetical protein
VVAELAINRGSQWDPALVDAAEGVEVGVQFEAA